MNSARLRGAAGVLLIEAAVVMLIIVAITASLAPTVTNAVDDARLLRARHDLSTIAVSMARLTNHVWLDRSREGGFSHYRLLVGPGLVPLRGTAAASGWDAAVGSAGVGLLDEQLLVNDAMYLRQPSPSPYGWRGPYVQQAVGPDPWGLRYAVNVGAMVEEGLDTLAVSAGPDGQIDAPFARDGGLPGGDDLLLVVSQTGMGQ